MPVPLEHFPDIAVTVFGKEFVFCFAFRPAFESSKLNVGFASEELLYRIAFAFTAIMIDLDIKTLFR